MNKSLFTLSTLVLCFLRLAGQVNLVPNGGFDIHSGCPNLPAQVNLASPWNDPPSFSTDLYDSCGTNGFSIPINPGGGETPCNGSAYAGIYVYAFTGADYREYIEAPLTSTLAAAHTYRVKYYVSLADSFQYAVSNLSAYFSSSGAGTNAAAYFTYSPQINGSVMLSNKNGWTVICDSFIAIGNESYITVGNFKDDLSTNKLYVGGSSTTGNPYDWREAYYYVDNISVVDLGFVGVREIGLAQNISLFPNPSSGEFQLKGNFPEKSELHIFDLVGNEVATPTLISEGEQNLTLRFNLAEGVYFYQILSDGGIIVEDRLLITK